MGMGDRQEGGGYTHQLSRQGQATRAQTRKSGSGLSQRTRRRVTQAPMTALWSLQGAPWQPWQPVPWGGCKLKTPSAGRSPCGTGSLPQQSPPQPDDGRSLHQWRSIQGQYWLELQKVQHNIQSALNKRRDSGRSSGSHSHSPTAMLEQMQERLHNIAQDLYILNRSCGEEIVRSSLARARKAAPKKRRRARRNTVRPVKQACSDTMEESISSTDDVARSPKEARWGPQRITTQLHHTHHVQHLLPP